jgi:hypothetical protein
VFHGVKAIDAGEDAALQRNGPLDSGDTHPSLVAAAGFRIVGAHG